MKSENDFQDHIVIIDGLIHEHHLILFHFEISKRSKEIFFNESMLKITVSCNDRYSSSMEIYFR